MWLKQPDEKPPKGWVAMKHSTSQDRYWCIAPKAYFDAHGRIPDTHANLGLPGVDEVSDHTLWVKPESGKNDRKYLESLGFEILDDPLWYFKRPAYDVCLDR